MFLLKFQPQEYIEYFEDLNLSLTREIGQKGYFPEVSLKGIKIIRQIKSNRANR
jgi:hypothetical protein